MNEIWNLDKIYAGFDAPAFAADVENLKEVADKLQTFAAGLPAQEPAEGLRRGICLLEQFSELANRLIGYAILRQSANTRDAEAGSWAGRLMAIYSGAAAPMAAFNEWASKLPDLKELVEREEALQDYTFYFEKLARSSKYLLPGIGEAVMARMSISGGSAWAEMQQYLTSTVPVTYRGETINLSAVRNLAYDPDPQVRRDAYEAEIACYDRIKDPVAYALNSIKLETLSECALRGYGSPLERTVMESDMKMETLNAMLEAMDEYAPKFWQYLKAKARALGHEGGLPWYDLFAPLGNSGTRFTPEDARNYLVEVFSEFDTELSDMIATAFDREWIDFYPREGKSGGAFCAEVAHLGESRVLTNFDSSFSAVGVLAHELGHAFHNQCVYSHRPLNQGYSMPLAETASTFNECVLMNAAISKAADKEEQIALIEGQLRDTTQIILDIYSRFRFEKSVFDKREQEFMSADTLCGLMLDAQKASYGDGLDHGCLHPYMWICKSHYYGPIYYNFPYAFGGLFARGLYARYEKEGASFVEKYKKLLHTTPIATAENVAKVAGIDLTDKDFWRAALQTVADQIDLLCKLLEE